MKKLLLIPLLLLSPTTMAACRIIEEVSALICQKEQFTLPSNTQKFMLYKIECRQTLSVSLSLYENDIKNGDRRCV